MNVVFRISKLSNFYISSKHFKTKRNEVLARGLRNISLGLCSLKINHSINDTEFLECTDLFYSKNENLSFILDDLQSLEGQKGEPDKPLSKINVDYSNPPLTRFVRNFVEQVKQQNFEFINRLRDEILDSDYLESPDPRRIERIAMETIKPSEITLKTFDLKTSGENFVDDTWCEVLSDKEYKIWRKEIENKTQTEYIHKVSATYHDITAQSFLEVQLNLDLRHNWDDHIINLNAINKNQEENSTEVIHWVTKFPFPLADREYLYMRRWAKAKIPEGKEISIIINKSAPSKIYDEIDYKEVAKGKLMFNPESLIKVEKYFSYMIVCPHESIDKKGMDFYLIYYDDPKFRKIPGSSLKWISSKTIPKFMDQVHSVAKRIEKDGIPSKIQPIFVKNDMVNQHNSLIDKKYAAREIDEVAISAFYKTKLFPTWLRPQHSEKHHLIFT